MNLGTMRSALQRRGFNDVSTTDLDQAINDACVELDAMYPWPYREKSTIASPAPLEIDDLGQVDEVLDMDNGLTALIPIAWDELAAAFGDTSITGTPVYWYTATPEGVPELSTFPVSDHDIGVQYWRVTPVLDSDDDEPLAPDAWHSVIVDIAALALYPDGEGPPGIQARIDRRVSLMVNSLMADYGPTQVVPDGVDG